MLHSADIITTILHTQDDDFRKKVTDKSLTSGHYFVHDMFVQCQHGMCMTLERNDFFHHIKDLNQLICEGRIDGSSYTLGTCHCWFGSLGKLSGRHYDTIRMRVGSFPLTRSVEMIFSEIKKGDRPETNLFSSFILQTLQEMRPN